MNERIQNGTELYHHGILGQKWGVRRFQNADGTRTAAGEKRYSDKAERKAARAERREAKKQIKRDYREAKRLNSNIKAALEKSYDIEKDHDLKAERAEYNKAVKKANEFVKSHPQYEMITDEYTIDGSMESDNGDTTYWHTHVDAKAISAVKGTDAYNYGVHRSNIALAAVGGVAIAYVAASMRHK